MGKSSQNYFKVGAVKEFPVPKTKKEVRAFLGLTGYYRRLIPNYSAIAVSDLTKKPVTNQIVSVKRPSLH